MAKPLFGTKQVGSSERTSRLPLRNLFSAAAAGASVALALLPGGVVAEEPSDGKFWAGVEIGAANVRRTVPVTRTDSTFYLDFKGGYAVSRRWLVGAELGGYTLEAGDLWDPSKGAGVSQVFAITQYYLRPERRGWYVKGGAGYVSYWDNRPGGREDDGWGVTVALGFDWRTDNFGVVGPLISYGAGRAGDLDHRAMTVALSWAFP